MKNRKMRAVTGLMLCMVLCSLFVCTPADAAVKVDHPRIWLSTERMVELRARASRNTAAYQEMISWCNNHLSDNPSDYISDAAYGLSMVKAANFALAYQLTNDTRYSAKATAIVMYAVQNPPQGDLVTWFSYYRWYPARYALPGMALTLDWCWAAMTTAEQDTIAAGLDRICNGMLAESGIWAWNDPSNNYYYGDMWGLLSAAYALYYHHTYGTNAERYLSYARGTMLDQAIKFTKDEALMWDLWGSSVGRAKGGLWNEGTSYGCVNYEFLFSSVLATQTAEGITYGDYEFPDESVKYFIYSKHPSGSLMYSDGDGAAGGIDATVRIPVLFAISLATGDTKGHGQYWVNTYTSRCNWSYKLYNEFLWYDDQLSPVYYGGAIPDYHYAKGTQVLFWRSDWTESATWLAIKLGVLNTDHAHNGLGNIMLYRQGFLATDKAVETGDGTLHGDIHHSVLYIPPTEDKKLFWGESSLKHRESTPNYIYLAGDLTGCYTAQPDYRENTVAHKEREIIIIKPENAIAVMDRGTSFDTAHDKIFQIYLHNQAVQSGSDYRSSNGSSDLVLHPAYPVGATVTLDTYGAPRLRITTAAAQLSKSFLNVLKVTGAGGAFEAPQATASIADIAAAAFYGTTDAIDYVVAFSTAFNGTPSSASSFAISFESSQSAVRAYLANLQPSTTYYLKGALSGTTATLTVSRTTSTGAVAYLSNAEGLLFGEVNLDEAEAGPDPAEPDGIDSPSTP